MAAKQTIGNRIAPVRFILFVLIMIAGWVYLIPRIGVERGLLLGFDIAAGLFLLTCISLLNLGAAELRVAAAKNDANRWLLLAISLFLTLVILAAIAAQLGSTLDWVGKLLIVVTLVLIWTFGNTIYALHYAHLYYLSDRGGKDLAGLEFPGDGEPDMRDFAYFAFILGVAVQTADVAITSRHIRHVVTIHCIAGFFFNLGVLSLAVNVLGSS